MDGDGRFRELIQRYTADPDWLPSVAEDITDAIHGQLAGLDTEELRSATYASSESVLAVSFDTLFGWSNVAALTNPLVGTPLRITASGAFNINQPISNSGSVAVQAGGDLTIIGEGTVSSTASGDAVTLESKTVSVKADVTIEGDLTVKNAAHSTKISGNTVEGA